MAKDQATKIQILSAEHPDMLAAVNKMFDKFATILQVKRMLERQYHVQVGITAISSYKKNHWKAFKDQVREQKASMVAIGEIIGENGLSLAVNALLWQELQTLTPVQLISFRKVLNDSEKVAVLRKQFALVAQEHRQKMKDRTAARKNGEAAEDPAEEYARAQRVVAQVKEMFGIGMSDPSLPPRGLPGAGNDNRPQEDVDASAEQPPR